MKRTILILLAIVFIAVILVVVALKVPIPLATNSDFKVIYYTNQGLTLGIDVYNHTTKINMINDVYGTAIDENFMPQFADPPWYALSTFYLGLFTMQQAAILWFEINLVMLFLSVFFLTDGWKPIFRLLAFPASLFFYPVLGTLAIGQYDFPVLLGTSMLIYAIRNKLVPLTVFSMVLLTFKPHLGGLILLAGLIYLFLRKDDFGKNALKYTIAAGVFLFFLGFLADSNWLLNYLGSLFSYRDLGHITTCSECVNISVWLSRNISGELSLSQAGAIASVILITLIGILFYVRKILFQFPSLLFTSALMVTILASPYLYNYDFLLLLVPFTVILNSKNNIKRIAVILCYFIPTILLILYGRDGNGSLLIASLVITFILFLYIKSQVDVPASASYNTSK
jgi:hypothetical protein